MNVEIAMPVQKPRHKLHLNNSSKKEKRATRGVLKNESILPYLSIHIRPKEAQQYIKTSVIQLL